MTSVNDETDLHVAALLGLALVRVRTEMLADVEAEFPGLRVSHLRLLELIPAEGARITDLAEIAGMTKQGLGQHVDYLQARGYTDSVRQPDDRRVRLVRRTARGDAAGEFSRQLIAKIEQEWEAELGPQRYAAFRAALADIGRVDH
jgi:DNA-binding MarR family transcriptional regulator